jgi:putative FmdB family regulatory protein
MPFYEYECPSCKYYLEVLQKISDKPVKKCPSCGKAGIKRLMSAPVFRLKGSGWYETDFKSDKEGQRNLAGADPAEPKVAAPEAKAGSEDKTAKPEATAPAAEPAKSESAAPEGKSKKPSKAAPAAARSASARRATKRPAAASPKRKGARKTSRGSRRR